MRIEELAFILSDMYTNAEKGEKMTMIYLFGIRYHKEISNYTAKEVVKMAGMRISFHAELSKALRLARYVAEKDARN